jgi:hypothetical protein
MHDVSDDGLPPDWAGREIDVEGQKALCKVKHSCSEVTGALTLRFEERSGKTSKTSARGLGRRAPLRAARGVRRFEVTSHKK